MVVVYLFNVLGVAMFFVPLCLFMVGFVYLPDYHDIWTALSISGAIMLFWDLFHRFTKGKGRLFWHSSGGQMYFIPTWIIGLGMIFAYVHLARTHNQWLPKFTPPSKSASQVAS